MNSILNQILVTSLVVISLALITVLIYYLFNKKFYDKQRKNFENLHLNLKVNDQVEFSNGLIGTIVKVGAEYCDIKVKSGAVITVSRFAISRFVEGDL